MKYSLSLKLSALLLLLFLVVGISLVIITRSATGQYYEEVTQQLNASIGMYVAQERPLLENGAIHKENIEFLAHQAMVINPTLEIYIIDTEGKVLWPDNENLHYSNTSIDAVHAFVEGNRSFPLKATNPKNADEKKIFSAFPIQHNETVSAYVFAILGGEYHSNITSSLNNNLSFKLSTYAIVLTLVFAFGAAVLGFLFLTRPLQRLQRAVETYHLQDFETPVSIDHLAQHGDESGILARAISAMALRIQTQLEQLKTNDQNRRQLIANVSHDLRTPISALQGYLEAILIKREQLSKEETQRHVNTAYEHSKRLSQLVSELFELARLDTSGITLHLEQFSLAELLHDVAQQYEMTAQQKGVTLNVDSDNAHCWVQADISLIQRVFENLIGNAIRHTPEGGTVELKAQQCTHKICVSVTDTGSGISQEDIPFVFEQFYRGTSAPTDDNTACTGLGLTIAQRIVSLHQSSIAVVSSKGCGSSFSFELPLASA